jgi:hypothetical protein
VALAWWFVLCLPFPGLLYIYFQLTARLRNFREFFDRPYASKFNKVNYAVNSQKLLRDPSKLQR